ncbi:bifunctional methylenetetrahydrofolate dehydrogenase/methenyltetrahydrofolate cyclohydrolase FolD [Hazenella sp. IB182357]|uniref:Bifunctional protein FolD n=1 Tax=Polycladospora coralii TaxID=2771432 RepID=A0A926ND82_9BACL|nr:bifunctional methylenetetrahydrofolate dehydrogenase/methenyltetrahydrofolate cyclohydrolase FolD [Polycladospora coralii]MBD1373250.1 bifunctional methylenetetrahydrofolate dehydrogenase/methenyltetrahydrofolate cyclohydrolase FolD [Polycladospora coralii]MBS7530908.1 bifunctional methylenetetrahydrofolate dehydrogenase/methenyltetrahydrofolate cyclohydrolase FolD [Polycladospora coralii]
MSYQLIDGKGIAAKIRLELKEEVDYLIQQGITPGLVVILVGNHPASESYVKGKIKASAEVGIDSQLIRLPAEITETELLARIVALNEDPSVDGILVQLPLPDHIDADRVIQTIDPKKDVDGFTPINMGNLVIGQEAFIPCTPAGIMELFKRYEIDVAGKHAVVIGRSNIVGKPISLLLQQANATVTMCHSRTRDLLKFTQQADIIIAAVGREHMLTSDYIKPGAVVIDVGINRNAEGKLVGDVKFDEVAPLTKAITPVPKGVGPMTIAMLMANTVLAAKRR